MQAGVLSGPIERSSAQRPTPGGPLTHDLNVPYEGTEEYETPTAEMLFPPVSTLSFTCLEYVIEKLNTHMLLLLTNDNMWSRHRCRLPFQRRFLVRLITLQCIISLLDQAIIRPLELRMEATLMLKQDPVLIW